MSRAGSSIQKTIDAIESITTQPPPTDNAELDRAVAIAQSLKWPCTEATPSKMTWQNNGTSITIATSRGRISDLTVTDPAGRVTSYMSRSVLGRSADLERFERAVGKLATEQAGNEVIDRVDQTVGSDDYLRLFGSGIL